MYSGYGLVVSDAKSEQIAGVSKTSFVMAVPYGQRLASGIQPTQFVSCDLYGQFGEQMRPVLKRGQAVVVSLQEPHVALKKGQNGREHYVIEGVATSVQLLNELGDVRQLVADAQKTMQENF